MTRKDYELIASAIQFGIANEGDMRIVAYYLAGALLANNPRFDRKRFLAACGISDD